MRYGLLTGMLGAGLFLSGAASACATGAKCMTAPASSTPVFVAGDLLAPGEFNVLLNAEYYGLPRAEAGSWYVTIDKRVLRIESDTYRVIEDVTYETNRAF